LSVHSDPIALLVLDHQIQMHNLITLTNYQTRFALHRDSQQAGIGLAESPSEEARRQYESAADLLIRYLLFIDEAPLEGPVAGSSGFAEAFMKTAVRDPQGRSLRDLNLRSRTFEYPCSFLLYSKAFDSLPTPVKDYVYHRLYEILSGQDRSPDFARLEAPQRRAILEILRATKPDLPREWHTPVDE
jgi:hypothetical protein